MGNRRRIARKDFVDKLFERLGRCDGYRIAEQRKRPAEAGLSVVLPPVV
jgi:hypothetical protein